MIQIKVRRRRRAVKNCPPPSPGSKKTQKHSSDNQLAGRDARGEGGQEIDPLDPPFNFGGAAAPISLRLPPPLWGHGENTKKAKQQSTCGRRRVGGILEVQDVSEVTPYAPIQIWLLGC